MARAGVTETETLMQSAEGARNFRTSGAAYDAFMGRYSRQLAPKFADEASVQAGMVAVDIGCGPGALTGVLVDRLGAQAVHACDPSPEFVADCSARFPDVDVRSGRAESIPFADGIADLALAQLVLHFVSNPPVAANELRRIVRPGGTVAACVWDFDGGMEMLRAFWDAALVLDPSAPDEARTLRFGRPGEIAELLAGAGLVDVVESTIEVSSTYASFAELWAGFIAGIGPAGAYCVSLPDSRREDLEREFFDRVGSPAGAFTLAAMARSARGRVPG
jgi:ubiquinone/menaquinone biosynthesis C-methylase UbiE